MSQEPNAARSPLTLHGIVLYVVVWNLLLLHDFQAELWGGVGTRAALWGTAALVPLLYVRSPARSFFVRPGCTLPVAPGAAAFGVAVVMASVVTLLGPLPIPALVPPGPVGALDILGGLLIAVGFFPAVRWSLTYRRFLDSVTRIPTKVSLGYANRLRVADQATLSSGQRHVLRIFQRHLIRNAWVALAIWGVLTAVGVSLIQG